jgi:uncharacterized protein involved in exopolysaccharide biosynthesis
MSESRTEPRNSGDEVDLLQLFAKAVLAVRANIILFVVTFILGTLIGLAYYQFVPKVYQSKMLISSDILTESYSKALVDNLNKLIKEENSNSLSEELRLLPDQASKIVEINIKSALEKPGESPENTKTYLAVEVMSEDNSIWPQVQNGIVDYFQYNEFVKIRVEQRKKYMNQVIDKINLELADLEKLKNKISEDVLIQSNKQNLVLFDPTTVNSKILDLNKEKINLQNSLETVNSVQVVDGFIIFNKPSSPKLSISVAAGSFFGLVLAGCIMVFKIIRSVVRYSEATVNPS